MTQISKPALLAVFRNRELLVEWNQGLELWGLLERITKQDPDERFVEMALGNVLDKLTVREVQRIELAGLRAVEIFQDTPLYVCIVSSCTVVRDSEKVSFYDRYSLPAIRSLTNEARAVISVPSVWDRFL